MLDRLTKPATVLALDDSPLIHQLIKRALESDYQVIALDNPMEALSIICHQPISVLILDVQMPGINGLEFCRTVRTLPQVKHLPVIMLTSQDRPFDRVRGQLAGATEYLIKPFDADKMRDTIQKLLNASTVVS